MSWDTGDKCTNADECSWAEQYTGSTIWLTPEVQSVIKKLCKDIESEWQMLLTGIENKEGVWVTGYWIPKQEVTLSSVKNLDLINADVIKERGIICTIHSHASMGVFFSGVDEKFTNNSLIKNHIVVNNKGEMKACMRYELPCKMTHFFDANVSVISPIIESIEGFDNITKKTYQYTGMPKGKWWEDEGNTKWDTDKRKMGKGKKKKKRKRHHAITHLERGEANEHGVMHFD